MYASKQCVVRTNKVAPVIIKDCREEFQQFLEFNEPIVKGCLAEGMPEHPLIKGKYFVVQDANDAEDVLQTFKTTCAPNFHQASSSYPVFASGQPTVNGLNKVLSQLICDGYSEILVLNLRSEPVLFQRVDEDYVPYSVRHQEQIHNMVGMGDIKESCDHIEACIRKEIVSLASMEDEFVFYFYDSLQKLQQEPHMRKVEYEEDILLSAEVYARESFSNQILRHDRICLPELGIPTEEMVDQFLSHFKEKRTFLEKNSHAFPVVYLISHSGGRRSAIMMVMSCLLYAHKRGSLKETCSYKMSDHNPDYIEGEYKAIQELVAHLKDGNIIKQQVDWVIDQCSEVINLRRCIANHKRKLETAVANNSSSQVIDTLYAECLSSLETYAFLISFNAYLRDQMPNNLSWSYNKWLHRNPEVNRLISELDFSELSAPPSLLSTQHRFLVADDYIGLDVLSSQMDVKVSNFRRLMGLPIYGMAQPNRNGLFKVVNHLLHHKQGYTYVVMINLRSDYVLEIDDVTYHVRDVAHMAEPVPSLCTTGRELEEAELKLKKEIKSKRSWSVYIDTADPPVDRELVSIFTPEELYEQQRLSTLDLHYRRLPLHYDHGLREKEFDAIKDLVLEYMTEAGSWTDNSHAFVFHCRTGKSRTSLAMAVVGLLFYHMTGFPYGANADEEERVSCPNAKYTKGEFLVVERLVWMLPQGQQVKREVDLVLDRLFETMSPMHFHLREVIFVTFNKAKSANCSSDRRQLHRLSYDYLERYLYLILFNAYLHTEKAGSFTRSFSQWMMEVAAPAGVYELLDNLGFFLLEQGISEFSRLKNRILDRRHKLPFTGHFV
ncbi:paladin [Plakobranchus ocellatus]|uniref:Paladin n=1 Tax=Plakobranchus ocellatus TaxID=259542 RepID=A0AAV3ZBU9_9GAST|nr:paladin [Plakobranchus ocellatus]